MVGKPVLVLVLVLVPVLVLVLVLVPCSCSCSCSCRAPSASRARRARRARRGPRSWSSCVVLVVNVVPAPRIFLLACLSSCWKSSAGRTPTRQRATFASKVMRSPARRAYLPKRSSQKIHHLAAQSSRAHRPDGANFAPSFFFFRRRPRAGAAGADRAGGSAPALFSRGGSQGELMGPVTQYHR